MRWMISITLSFTSVIAELAEVDALPCAEVQLSMGDGDGEAHPEERAFGMRRHVVQSFHGVVVIRFVLLHETVHNLAEVGTHIGIGILVNGESARSVLYEKVQHTRLRQWLR